MEPLNINNSSIIFSISIVGLILTGKLARGILRVDLESVLIAPVNLPGCP